MKLSAWASLVRKAGLNRPRKVVLRSYDGGEYFFQVYADPEDWGEEKEGEFVCAMTEARADLSECWSCPWGFEGKLPRGREILAYCFRAGCLCVLRRDE